MKNNTWEEAFKAVFLKRLVDKPRLYTELMDFYRAAMKKERTLVLDQVLSLDDMKDEIGGWNEEYQEGRNLLRSQIKAEIKKLKLSSQTKDELEVPDEDNLPVW